MRSSPARVEQVVEFAESLDGKRAGRFQEHLEDARPVAPDKRISAPHILHTISSFTGSFAFAGREVRERAGPDVRGQPGLRATRLTTA